MKSRIEVPHQLLATNVDAVFLVCAVFLADGGHFE